MKKCYCCGAEVPDDAKFCVKCGKPMEITQDLIDRARAGDSDAQTELYERTYKTVYSRTRAKVPDEDMVMDIMQETYLRAFTNLDQLKKAETFPSWLLTIASRQASNWFRKNGKDQENIQLSQLEYENDDTLSDEDDPLEMPETQIDLIPDQALDRAETGRLLSEILDTLPEDQRMILTMRYYDDMSLKEISEELGVNLSTVKSRLTAGQKKVKAKVLELEKSGTKLYSLGPVAFLVYLLRHAELFAPDIPSNTILGLTGTGAAAGGASAASVAGSTAAGGASTGAGGAVSGGASAGGAASNIAGGTAAKASVAAAAKGISVRAAVAIVAAAVVVAGGGITTAVVVTNNNDQLGSETAVVETPNNEIEPPTEEIIHEMVDPLAFWSVNDMYSDAIAAGPIEPTVNEAAELAAAAYYLGNYNYDDPSIGHDALPETELSINLRNLFGPEYQLSEFTNTMLDSSEDSSKYISAFPENRVAERMTQMTLFKEEDEFYYQFPYWRVEYNIPEDTVITNIEMSETAENKYDVSVEYNCYYSRFVGVNDSGEEINEETHQTRDVEYELTSCEESDYGWIISRITYKGFHEPGSDQEAGDIVYAMNSLSEKQYNMLGAMDIFDNYGNHYSWDDTYFVTSAFSNLIRYHAPDNVRKGFEIEGVEGVFSGASEDFLNEAASAMFPDFNDDFSQFESTFKNEPDLAPFFQDGFFYIYIDDGGRGDVGSNISYWAEHADGTCTVEIQYEGVHEIEAVYRLELVKNKYTESYSNPYFIYSIASMENLYIGDRYNRLDVYYQDTGQNEEEKETTSPSEEAVLNLADIVITTWGANAVERNSGQIYLNTNQAVEMATNIAFWREKDFVQDFESYYPTSDTVANIIPASTVQSYMTMLFGSQFSLSDFSNTGTTSAFKTSIPGFVNYASGSVSRNSDGDYEIYYSALLEFDRTGANMSVESITPSGTDTYLAVVQFDNVTDDKYLPESHTMEFGLVEDPSADYGWAITSLSF